MPEKYYDLSLFEEVIEETDFFNEEFGRNADIYDLIEGSQKALKEVQDELMKDRLNLLSPKDIEEKKLKVKKEDMGNWKGLDENRIGEVGSFVADYLAPYFPLKLYKVVKTNRTDRILSDIGDRFEEIYNISGRTKTTNGKRIKDINKGDDRREGYFLFNEEYVPDVFSEAVILRAGGIPRKYGSEAESVSKEALIRMCKDRGHVEEYYPDTKSEFIERYKELRHETV